MQMRASLPNSRRKRSNKYTQSFARDDDDAAENTSDEAACHCNHCATVTRQPHEMFAQDIDMKCAPKVSQDSCMPKSDHNSLDQGLKNKLHEAFHETIE